MNPKIDFADVELARIRRPEILLDPNIPKPLHTLNPRTLLGQEWWDTMRKMTYALNNYHCFACGVHQRDAAYKHWLEAHERYEYDYQHCTATMIEVVALCHYCHNFIHSGRLLAMLGSGEIPERRVKGILIHGADVLRSSGQGKMWHGTYNAVAEVYGIAALKKMMKGLKPFWYPYEANNECSWSKWKLILEGKEYPSRFKDINEWQNHWRGVNIAPNQQET